MLKGKILFRITKDHPDWKYLKEEEKIGEVSKQLEFEDTYAFREKVPKSNMKAYIKNDLLLVAGGGYDTKHVYDVKFVFE